MTKYLDSSWIWKQKFLQVDYWACTYLNGIQITLSMLILVSWKFQVSSCFKKKIFKAILGSHPDRAGSTESWRLHAAPTLHHSYYQYPASRQYICQSRWMYIDTVSSPKVHTLLQGSLVTFCGFWQMSNDTYPPL